MKIKDYKKTKFQQVAEILEKQGHITDSQSAKIFGENRLYCVTEHVRKWKRLKSDRDFFKGKKIVEKTKGHRCHLVRLDTEPANSWYKVGKEFYQELDIYANSDKPRNEPVPTYK